LGEKIKTRFFVGSAWMIGWRWLQRAIGVVSVVILARLLSPEDFGIVAMAAIVVGLLDTLSSIGVVTALVQSPVMSDEHLNTGWTIRLIQRAVVALALLPAAHLGADYFNDERIVPVIYVGALTVFLGGFENIGVIFFQRDLNFRKDFIYGLIRKLVGFVVTVALAFTLRNYWALVLGTLSANVAGLFLSYAMHSHRPRLSLSRFKEIWAFSQWLLFSGIIGFIRRKADQAAVDSATWPWGTMRLRSKWRRCRLRRLRFPLAGRCSQTSAELLVILPNLKLPS